MELKFHTNDKIRKLVAVWDMFGRLPHGINTIDERILPLNKNCSYASRIYEQIRQNTPNIWIAFFDDKIGQINHDTKFEDVSKLLDMLDISLEHDDALLDKIKAELTGNFAKYGAQADMWIRKIFGFELPEEVNIILDLNEKKDLGSFVASNPPIVARQMNKNSKNPFSVFLHEVLHTLVNQSNMKSSEALLDYFAPSGIIDQKIGILDSLDIDELHRRQVFNRQWSRGESEKLLPYIKEYYKVCGDKTIWDFLKEKSYPFS